MQHSWLTTFWGSCLNQLVSGGGSRPRSEAPCTPYPVQYVLGNKNNYQVGNKWPSRPHGGRTTKCQVCFQDKVGGYILIKCWQFVYPINTVSPFTAYWRRLVIRRIWVERGGDTTIKTLVIASCESCPSRGRRCYIILGT